SVSSLFFQLTPPTEIATLSLHDALPILAVRREVPRFAEVRCEVVVPLAVWRAPQKHRDRLGGSGPVHIRVQRHAIASTHGNVVRSEEHTSELQSLRHLVCRLLLEKKK